MTTKEFKERNPGAVKVRRDANNTIRATYPDGTETVTLHNTVVVTKKPDGTLVLNSGGWHTVTTKDRINKELPHLIGITQKDYSWYVVRRAPDYKTEIQRVPFKDGLYVFPDGSIIHPDDIPL